MSEAAWPPALLCTVICTPEGKEVGLAVVSAGNGFDKEVNSFELSIAGEGWLLLLPL